ncbi:magnesium transporter CorA family protein [Porticoccus sp.]
MLRATLLDSSGQLKQGGRELVDEWRQNPDSRLWLDMYEEDEAEEAELLASFGVHHLAILDAQRKRHPPKLEVFDDHLFILLRGLDAESRTLDFGTIQIALFAGDNFLLTRRGGISVSINDWWGKKELAKMMANGGIHLALALATTAARRYTELLLNFEPTLSELEDGLQEHPDDQKMRELTGYRTRLRKLRRIFSYLAGVFEALREVDEPLFSAESDAYRHQVIDVYEKYERLLSLSSMYYEVAGDLVDGYISLTSHELNSTMRILTVLTAIFIPLGFLAGVYGMNFDNMPELHTRSGYFVLLAVMVAIATTLLVIFKRNKWL